jgi:hypothetical protein
VIFASVNQCVKVLALVGHKIKYILLNHCELNMSVLNRRLVDMSAIDTVTEIPAMSRTRETRTISSGGAFLSLSFVGLAFLIIGPALVKAQSSSRTHSPYKGFSGLWLKSDSVKQVYYHDQTVAVVELGPGKILQNCELVEVT